VVINAVLITIIIGVIVGVISIGSVIGIIVSVIFGGVVAGGHVGGGKEVCNELSEPFVLKFNLLSNCGEVDGFAFAMVDTQ